MTIGCITKSHVGMASSILIIVLRISFGEILYIFWLHSTKWVILFSPRYDEWKNILVFGKEGISA